MALAKATWFFKYGDWGWSETHYRIAASQLNFVAEAVDVAKARANLFGSHSPKIIAISLRFDDGSRQSNTFIPAKAYEFSQPVPAIASDVADTSVRVFAESGRLYRRTIFLSGIPDVIWDSDHIDFGNVPFDWLGNYRAWTSLLINGWGFRAASRDPGVAPEKPISSVSLAGGIVLLTVPAHGFLTNDRVIVRKVKNPGGPRIQGRWFVDLVDANSFTLRGSAGPVPIYRGGGLVRKEVLFATPYTNMEIHGLSHRKRGHTFFEQPVGRSKKRS